MDPFSKTPNRTDPRLLASTIVSMMVVVGVAIAAVLGGATGHNDPQTTVAVHHLLRLALRT